MSTTDVSPASVAPAAAHRSPVRYGLLAVVLLAAVALPFVVGESYLLRLAFVTFLYIGLASAWNLIGGLAGQVSFGHAAFFGVGAYVTGILWLRFGLHPLIGAVASGVLAAAYAFIIGVPTLRLRGPYFSIATIGVGEATRLLALYLADLTGGASGLSMPQPEQISEKPGYFTALVFAIAVVLVSAQVERSRMGLALAAIRMDEDAAQTLGVHAARYKVLALLLSACIVGVGGSIYTPFMLYIQPDLVFGFSISIAMVLMPVIGGVGTLWGPVIGGVIFVALREQLEASFQGLHLLAYGLLVIVIIMFEPAGLAGVVRRVRRWRARRRMGWEKSSSQATR